MNYFNCLKWGTVILIFIFTLIFFVAFFVEKYVFGLMNFKSYCDSFLEGMFPPNLQTITPEIEVILSDKTFPLEKIVPPSVFSSNSQLIPRIIIQTNERDEIDESLYISVENIQRLNREYEYRYFSDADCRKFLQDNYDDEVIVCYDDLIPGAFKADLFRVAYLFKNGGVYCDMGFMWLEPFRNFIGSEDTFVSPQDGKMELNEIFHIYNAFIACTPNHPILKNALDRILTNVKNRDYGTGLLDITGPKVLGRAFQEVMSKKVSSLIRYENGVRILQHYGYWKIGKGVIYDEGQKILALTKTPFYRELQKIYNSKRHYLGLYYEKKCFRKQDESNTEVFQKKEKKSFVKKISFSHSKVIGNSSTRKLKDITRKFIPAIDNNTEKNIIQIYPSDKTTARLEMCIDNLRDLNPDYNIYLFTRNELLSFLNMTEELKNLDPLSQMKELGRIYTRKYGGIYIPVHYYGVIPLAETNFSDLQEISDKYLTDLVTTRDCPYTRIIFHSFYLGFDEDMKNLLVH